ncbi:MAG: helix-turn-helix domain-containing protein [Micropepsaceae bacterium]
MKSKPNAQRAYEQGARAEQAEATYRRILDAFMALAREKWLDDVTLAEIAADAGVTVQTVIRRFGGKDGLISAFNMTVGPEIEARRRAGAASHATAIAALIDDYEMTGDFVVRLLAQEQRHEALKPVLANGRAKHREQTALAFADVLSRLTPAARERHLKALIAVTDVYVWQVFRRDMGIDRKAVTALVLETVNKLNAAAIGAAASLRRAS